MEVISRGPIYRVRRARRALNLSVQKYAAIMRVSIASNLAYVMEVFFRALLLVVLVFVLAQLWTTTYTTRGVNTLNGFSISDMVWYLVIAETIAMSLPQLTRRIDQDVRSGQLAYLLGRPCNYVFYNFAQYLGERLVRLVINIPVAATVALVFVGLPNFTWMGVVVWPLVDLLAVSIYFVVYFRIA